MTDGDGHAGDRESDAEPSVDDDQPGPSVDDDHAEPPTDEDESVADRENPAIAEFPEPEEFDPEERFGNAEEDLVNVPEVDVPEVENPADRLPDPSEVDKEVRDAFWTAVLWMDIALPCLVLGPVYVFLGGSVQIGGVITLAGVLASFRLYQTVRAFRQRRDGEGESTE